MDPRLKVYGAADSLKPYVERAMSDEKLRSDVMRAVKTANELYRELISDRSEPVRIATRVATDDDVRDKLRDAIEDLRSAGDRLKGRPDHSARNTTLLLVGITLGLLYNPISGPETRRFIREMLGGGSSDQSGDTSASTNGRS